jgi:hypothetical protein
MTGRNPDGTEDFLPGCFDVAYSPPRLTPPRHP